MGKQGSGKTLLGKLIFAYYALTNSRKYCVGLSAKSDLAHPRIPSEGPCFEIDFENLGFQELTVGPQEGFGFSLRAALRAHSRIIITEQGLAPMEREAFLDFLAEDAMELGSMVMLIDEAERYFPQHRASKGMLDLIRRARWRGIDLILVAHNDTSVHHEVSSEVNAIICFRQQQKTRLERLSHFVEDVDLVAQLPKYGYILSDDEMGARVFAHSTRDLQEMRLQHPEIFVTRR
jgi:hypothetical protein